jgi:hypothetical protein
VHVTGYDLDSATGTGRPILEDGARLFAHLLASRTGISVGTAAVGEARAHRHRGSVLLDAAGIHPRGVPITGYAWTDDDGSTSDVSGPAPVVWVKQSPRQKRASSVPYQLTMTFAPGQVQRRSYCLSDFGLRPC